MKKSDFICLAAFLAAVWAVTSPAAFPVWQGLESGGRGRLGFLAFALMGPLGEAAAGRLGGGGYPRLARTAAAALGWGLYGLAAALFFWLFNGAVALAQASGLLPGGAFSLAGSAWLAFLGSFYFLEPFFTGLLVVFCFTQPFLLLNRLGGAALDLWLAEGRPPGLARASAAADWPGFLRREAFAPTLVRTIFLTFVFMLPPPLWLPLAAWFQALLAALTGLSGRAAAPAAKIP